MPSLETSKTLVIFGISLLALLPELYSQEESGVLQLSPLVIDADRLVQPQAYDDSNAGMTLSNTLLGGAQIGLLDLSEAVAQYPAYAAFRKTPARAAHPTTQGVRLRNLGINSTSRSIVTLDGVPQNDPFGGWIYWQRYHASSLYDIQIKPSSGSEAWGNYGTGGHISLKSISPKESRIHAKLTGGSDGTKSASISSDTKISQNVSFNLSALNAETDGFYTLRSDQRGSIDQKANSEAHAYQGLLRIEANESWLFTLRAALFEEDRVNGTPLSFNGTEATDFSITALHRFDDSDSGFNIVAYTQERDFHNQFTSVADDRNSERPALDQFAMPAGAEGASFNYFTRIAEKHDFSIGADIRLLDGDVNERFRNLGNGFTRLRKAGGEQEIFGLFSTSQILLSNKSRLAVTLRADKVKNTDGLRQEWNTESNAQIRNDRIAPTVENFFSNNLTLYHDFSQNLRGMMRQSSGFRAPTLNELYRPFRVKNDIIEANQNLDTEKHLGFEAGLRFNADDSWSISANVFTYSLDDMIANVVLSSEPGFNPLCGFVPSGGSCGQRLNLSESTVEGFEIVWESQLTETFNARAQFLYAPSEIDSNDAIPKLNGNEFPHSSPFRANISLDWLPRDELKIWSSIRYQENEYEDTGNRRILKDSFQIDGGIQYALSGQHALSLHIENLFDEEIETGISSAGLVSIGAPRTFWFSWDFSR